MSLTKGDHVIIKRDGLILTPDAGEAYHEFEVMEGPVITAYHLDGTPLEADYAWVEGDKLLQVYVAKLKVIK